MYNDKGRARGTKSRTFAPIGRPGPRDQRACALQASLLLPLSVLWPLLSLSAQAVRTLYSSGLGERGSD